MSTMKIDIAELRDKRVKEVKKLAEFLEEKVQMKADMGEKEIILKPKDEGTGASKKYLRILLRKFLHKENLKEEFRVIAGNIDVLVIKKRKTGW